MACKNNGCLCRRIVISTGVTFTDDTLQINLPAGAYENGEKYCLVIGQEIPPETTIAASVVVTIGDDTTTTYPLVNPNCTNIEAANIQYRARYATKVFTNIQSGVFKLLSPIGCNCFNCNSNSGSLPLPAADIATNTSTEGGSN